MLNSVQGHLLIEQLNEVWSMNWKITGRLVLIIGIILLSLSGCFNQPPENESIDSEDSNQLNQTEPQAPVDEMKTVRIVSSTWEPYEYEEDGVAKGIGVDVTVEVFKRMGYEATVTFVPFKRALDMIQSGEADMLTDVNKNDEREVYGIFIEEPILMSYTNLFVKTDSGIEYDGDIFDLDDYTFGINRGYTHGKEFDDAAAGNLLIVEEAEDTPQNLEKLVNNRIDILVENKLGVLICAKDMGYQDQIIALEPEYRSAKLYNMFSKANDLHQMAEKFNETLIEIKEDGTYQKIYDSYVK